MPPKSTKSTSSSSTAPARPLRAHGAAKKPAAKPATKPGAKAAAAKPAAEKKEEPPKVEKAPEGKRKTITQKQIAKVLIEDDSREIRDEKKGVLVIDNENHIAARFLPYSGANVLEASDRAHMDPERLRLGVMGAVRFGKPLAIDLGECGPDMYQILEQKFDDVQKGLLEKCMNRDICTRDNYESLLKDSDEDTYKVASYHDFEEEFSSKFIFMIVMKPMVYPISYTNKFFTITVEQQ